MNHSLSVDRDESANSVLDELIARITDKLQAGEAVDVETYAAEHPDLAEELRRLRPALEMLALAASPPDSEAPWREPHLQGELGDFRLLREVGRGGMGVVYEAEQISLHRRVALKVLPFAAMMDSRHLQRFHNEAQAAACLHHTNIVPVFFVGCERGVHFYAMQFIDGQPLSDLIRQLRQAEQTAPVSAAVRTVAYPESPGETAAAVPTVCVGGESTPRIGVEKRGRDYFRKVAELGEQAAEALDHAHQLGIVHRDIKPANLLLDGRGNLWVTDFGLAHMRHGEANLTLSGQMVGTPRYMSPEQAMAQRVPIDHRTDVYSLGATLYELLALRPVFAGEDRQELLQQIAFAEPARLRGQNKAIPAELETIVHKALEKRPQDRYATAQELADDLRRWLLDQPIRARRPSLRARLARWGRRHQSAVWAAALVLLVLQVFGFSFALWWVQQRTGVATEARAALQEAERWQQEEKWSEALSAIRRAQGVLSGFGADVALQQQIEQRGKDVEMAQRLEEACLQGTTVKDGHFDWEACIAAYAASFQWYGLDVEHLDPAEAGERIRSCSIQRQLVTALDHWAYLLGKRNDRDRVKQLLAVARAADPDPWRDRLRDFLEGKDPKALSELVASAQPDELPPAMAGVLARFTLKAPEAELVAILLRHQQQRHPNDFWVNHELASCLHHLRTPRLEEAIRFYTAAIALRPQSPGAHLNLGAALKDKGRLAEAIAEYREAIRLKIDFAEAHNNLGAALKDKGQVEEGIAEYQKAIRINKDFAVPHFNLGVALRDKGQVEEAIAEYKEAIRLNKDYAEAHNNLGNALRDKGQVEEGIAELREAIRLKKDDANAHGSLGNALRDKGLLDEAIAEYREAIRINKDFAEAHCNLGVALQGKGRLDEAIDEYREALRLKKDFAEAHCNLGNALRDKGLLDEAIAEYREAIRINKDFAMAHNNLGNALRDKGLLDEAIAECREAIRLKKDFAMAHNNLGFALHGKGFLDEAIDEYREAIRLKKDYAEAHNNLGFALHGKGFLDEAIDEYREAIRLKKDYAEAHYNLGIALAAKGQLDETIAEYREAIRLKKDFAEAHCNLGHCLIQKGQFHQAMKELRCGHELGSKNPRWRYPSAQWVRDCERLVELDDKLAAILSGQTQPTDTAERIALAQLCVMPFKKHYADAVRFFRDAFDEAPNLADDLNANHRYNAACAAALAGCGQGKDADKLDTKERARLRQQSLDWLRADLKAYREMLEKSAGKASPAIVQRMQHWLQDTDFAGVRGEEALAKLPEAEREAWRKLWKEVDVLGRPAAATTKAPDQLKRKEGSPRKD